MIDRAHSLSGGMSPSGIIAATAAFCVSTLVPCVLCTCAKYPATDGPHIQPRNTELTRMPYCPHSSARYDVAHASAALDVAYPAWPAMGLRVTCELTLTIDPRRAFFMCGRTSCVRASVPNRLTSRVFLQSSRSALSIGPK